MAVQKVVFVSDPFRSSNGVDATVHNLYTACFKAITSETQAELAFYMWNRSSSPTESANPKQLTDDLLAAVSLTGAQVKILFDIDYYEESEAISFKQHLLNGGIAEAWYPAKSSGFGKETGGTPKLHDKTLLFSQLTFSQDSDVRLAGQTLHHVVVQSSANIWKTQYSQSNQAVLYHGSEEFYNYHRELWLQSKADFQESPLKFTKFLPKNKIVEDCKIYALPREGNLIASILENIADEAGRRTPEIRIAIGHFSNTEVAHRLVDIAKLGGKAGQSRSTQERHRQCGVQYPQRPSRSAAPGKTKTRPRFLTASPLKVPPAQWYVRNRRRKQDQACCMGRCAELHRSSTQHEQRNTGSDG